MVFAMGRVLIRSNIRKTRWFRPIHGWSCKDRTEASIWAGTPSPPPPTPPTHKHTHTLTHARTLDGSVLAFTFMKTSAISCGRVGGGRRERKKALSSVSKSLFLLTLVLCFHWLTLRSLSSPPLPPPTLLPAFLLPVWRVWYPPHPPRNELGGGGIYIYIF